MVRRVSMSKTATLGLVGLVLMLKLVPPRDPMAESASVMNRSCEPPSSASSLPLLSPAGAEETVKVQPDVGAACAAAGATSASVVAVATAATPMTLRTRFRRIFIYRMLAAGISHA